MGKSGKKVARQSQADLVDMADRLEGKGTAGTIVTILNDVFHDVKWGTKSLIGLAVGGGFLGWFGGPQFFSALNAGSNIYLAALSTPLGGALALGAAGITLWGMRGIAGSVVAASRSIRRHLPGSRSTKALARRMKKDVGRLPSKEPSRINIENEKMIIRNDVLYAVSAEAIVDKVCIRIPEGVQKIAHGAFRNFEFDRPIHLILPRSLETLDLDEVPAGTRLVIRDPSDRGRLTDGLKYDMGTGRYKYGEKTYDGEGKTFESHLFECAVLEEKNPLPPIRYLSSMKEDLDLLGLMPEDKQRDIVQEAYESMVRGGITVRDFLYFMKRSTIPSQEYKGPVQDRCNSLYLKTAREAFYRNEKIRFEGGNPAVEELQTLLAEVRRVSGQEQARLKSRRIQPESTKPPLRKSTHLSRGGMEGGCL